MSLRWRPLPSRVEDAEDAYRLPCHVVDKQIVAVDDQFARADDTTRAAERRMRGQVTRLFREQVIQRQRSNRVVLVLQLRI